LHNSWNALKSCKKTPLYGKKVANSRLSDAFFISIGAFSILFSTVPELCKTLYYRYICSRDLISESIRRHTLKNKIHHAFKNNEFKVHYQPIIDLNTHKIKKIEALVRWIDERGYQYDTEEFIKIAEESDLINEIDMFVLSDTLSTINYLKATSNQDIEISFNVSPSIFMNSGNIHDDWIAKIIELRGLIGITVEITEQTLIQNPSKTEIILDEFKKHDINIAIDDFGVGYSSLNYLIQFPIDQIKIDKSIIAKIGNDTKSDLLVSVLLSLAKQLDIKVVAKGIENEAQLCFIKDHDCDFGQGYFFSEAHPIDYLADKLKLNY
jgi:EAL domain-containing protein (putative c-di-GMP-specific phosphodiesterase class I)